jgi:hypothetical protein
MLLAREFVTYISKQLVKSLTPGMIETPSPDVVDRTHRRRHHRGTRS